MKVNEKRYNIVETECFPCSWKVVSVIGKDDNAAYLFHRTEKQARYQIENDFHGQVIEILNLSSLKE
jgi:hypothetical protein